MEKLAFMYDLDETLSGGDEQYKDLLKFLGQDKDMFWVHNDEHCLTENMDIVLGYTKTFIDLAKRNGTPLTKSLLNSMGKNIEFFNGVDGWFDRINDYGKSKGFIIEHYLISCGIKEIIEGSSIADKLNRIYANCYAYDERGEACWLSQVVNYTLKTQYIFRVKKNLLDNLTDIKKINDKQSKDEQLPINNMFYFGDGDTDIPCMILVKENGGHSIAVYNKELPKKRASALKILVDGRVNASLEADYSEGSEIDKYVKSVIDKLAKQSKKVNKF